MIQELIDSLSDEVKRGKAELNGMGELLRETDNSLRDEVKILTKEVRDLKGRIPVPAVRFEMLEEFDDRVTYLENKHTAMSQDQLELHKRVEVIETKPEPKPQFSREELAVAFVECMRAGTVSSRSNKYGWPADDHSMPHSTSRYYHEVARYIQKQPKKVTTKCCGTYSGEPDEEYKI